MGGCVAKPNRCIGARSDSFDQTPKRKRKRRRRRIKRRLSTQKVAELVEKPGPDSDHPHRTPSIRARGRNSYFLFQILCVFFVFVKFENRNNRGGRVWMNPEFIAICKLT